MEDLPHAVMQQGISLNSSQNDSSSSVPTSSLCFRSREFIFV
ncbi:hypothetical protein AK973_0928 [Pseudomonas brassicacearum]|nr:hypothetical protein AK973_0928 [Pseudomonas brassicacearum]